MALRPVPRLELSDVTKAYGSLVAVDGVSLAVAPGEVHAVLGENGAGKSTLMKILYGVVQADAGRVMWNGEPVTIATPTAARRLGIGMVFQHFSLFPSLTVLENLVVSLPAGRSAAAIAAAATALAGQHGLAVDLRRTVDTLSVGERQRVEIVRCLLQDPRLIILDEPTSVLTPQAVEELFALLRALAASGCSILYVSHKLHEVRALCDSATILRRGRVVDRVDPRGETDASLAERMLGSVVPPPPRRAGAAAVRDRLVLRGLDRPADTPHAVALRAIDLAVRAGEILGIAGIDGNGQKQLAEAIAGQRAASAGSVLVEGKPVDRLDVGARTRAGLRYLTDDRLSEGTVGTFPISLNLLLKRIGAAPYWSGGVERPHEIATHAEELVKRYDVRTPSIETPIGKLSGGNIQKVLLARELADGARVVVFNKPTYGLDVQNIRASRRRIRDIAGQGIAVLLISTELDELIELSDRIAVMARGRLAGIVGNDEGARLRVGELMIGAAS